MKQRAYHKASDFFRMWVLSEHGGIYLDTDVELLKPLDPLRSHAAFLGFQQTPDQGEDSLVNSSIMGSEAGHWLPREAMNVLVSTVGKQGFALDWTGPGIITHVLRKHGLRYDDDHVATVDGVAIYPRRFFHPIHWDDTSKSTRLICDDTYAVHHSDATWVKFPWLNHVYRRMRTILRLQQGSRSGRSETNN